MAVPFDETGHGELSFQVNHLCFFTFQLFDFSIGANLKNQPVLDGNGLGRRVCFIHCVDVSVEEKGVSHFLVGLAAK